MKRKKFKLGWRSLWNPNFGAPAALLILYIANAVFTPRFATVSNTLNMLLQVSTTMLIAIGMTFVIASRGIDLTVGSTMALVSVIVALLIKYGIFVAVSFALSAALLVGFLNGFLISRLKLDALITTLAALILWRGIAQVVGDGKLVPFTHPTFEALGKGYLLSIPIQVVIAGVVIVGAFFCIHSTLFGHQIVAVGGNEEAARLAGIRAERVKYIVYLISALLAGLAGLIETARLGMGDPSKVGVNAEFDAIAAVVVGGTPFSGGRANVLGTVVGALLMQVISTSFNMLLIPFTWSLVLKSVIILFAIFLPRNRV
ncbi:ABC transporter permease [Anabaena azotica]|uniref:ABC transporter permease n=1 Tax=Anabaena azotica FACHB-119 TaxID=947527 RepID=A0ABR8DDH5_9NOST|nr:ABC transporter permease [Anabaena azotica]MBD2505285.1 ABC transporter permease [Anabaena azotica FACHB-119]